MRFHLPILRLQLQPLESVSVLGIGAGLANLGNTCFLNSVLQCLTYTPPLAAYLLSGRHEAICRASGFCAMCSLEAHVKQALAAPGRVVSPTNLFKNLHCIAWSFNIFRQEDAHEYMRYLIESLQKCCLTFEVPTNSSLATHKSLIYTIFGGRLRSQVKCTHCSFCSNTYDPFLDLSLEIVRAESLQKALAHFTAVEVLDGDNRYRCDKCKAKVPALKRFTIDKAPQILTIQFKRFSNSGGAGGKIDKKVQFGRTLDIKAFMSSSEEDSLKYTLYAVLVHSGWSTHSGHYYCFVRTSTDTWHVLDDSRVSQVSERTVLDQKAYILFYIREPMAKAACKIEDDCNAKSLTNLIDDNDVDAGDRDAKGDQQGETIGNYKGSLVAVKGNSLDRKDSMCIIQDSSPRIVSNSEPPSAEDNSEILSPFSINQESQVTVNSSLDVASSDQSYSEETREGAALGLSSSLATLNSKLVSVAKLPLAEGNGEISFLRNDNQGSQMSSTGSSFVAANAYEYSMEIRQDADICQQSSSCETDTRHDTSECSSRQFTDCSKSLLSCNEKSQDNEDTAAHVRKLSWTRSSRCTRFLIPRACCYFLMKALAIWRETRLHTRVQWLRDLGLQYITETLAIANRKFSLRRETNNEKYANSKTQKIVYAVQLSSKFDHHHKEHRKSTFMRKIKSLYV